MPIKCQVVRCAANLDSVKVDNIHRSQDGNLRPLFEARSWYANPHY